MKQAAPKLGMLEASDVGHLDNFLGAMRRAKNAKSSRESTMHSYFKKVSKDKQFGEFNNRIANSSNIKCS